MTSSGHVTSSGSCPIDRSWPLCYRMSIGTIPFSGFVSEIFSAKVVTTIITWWRHQQPAISGGGTPNRGGGTPFRLNLTTDVVRATIKVNGKPPILGTRSPQIPGPIDLKFDVRDYVQDLTPHAKNRESRPIIPPLPAKGLNIMFKMFFFYFVDFL